MTLVLSPQIESRLIREDRRKGMSPEAYAEILLQKVLPEGDEVSSVVATHEPDNRPRFGCAKGRVVMTDDFDKNLQLADS